MPHVLYYALPGNISFAFLYVGTVTHTGPLSITLLLIYSTRGIENEIRRGRRCPTYCRRSDVISFLLWEIQNEYKNVFSNSVHCFSTGFASGRFDRTSGIVLIHLYGLGPMLRMQELPILQALCERWWKMRGL